MQPGNFREAQAGRIGGHQDGAVLEAGDRVEELEDLSRAQDDGQLALSSGERDVRELDPLFEGDAVEEAQGADALVVSAPGGRFFVNQIKLVAADLCGAEPCGGGAEVLSELGDVVDVGADGARRHVT